MTPVIRHVLAATTFLLLPVASFAQSAPAMSRADTMRVDQRIKQLHDQLGITAPEQPQWEQYAQVMRDNATAMTHAADERGGKLDSMDATATMQSYADMAKLHGDNMEKLAGAFATLYASFSPAQKQKADTVFRARAETHAADRTKAR